MKKTIAILLVLVLAGAGLFAAVTSGSADLMLAVTIDPINQMAVTAGATYTWPDLGTTTTDFTSAYSDTAYGLTSANETASDIAYLQARSNNRNGFKIVMEATPLSSTQGTSPIVTEYIDYTVECGATKIVFSGATNTTTGTEVGSVGYTNNAGIFTLTKPINLHLTETLAKAADGVYTGAIKFTYTAS